MRGGSLRESTQVTNVGSLLVFAAFGADKTGNMAVVRSKLRALAKTSTIGPPYCLHLFLGTYLGIVAN